MSDCWMMFHTPPLSIQPAVNGPTVKHAGPANPCHTWRFRPSMNETTREVFLRLSLSSPQDFCFHCIMSFFSSSLPSSKGVCVYSPLWLLIKPNFGLSKHLFTAGPMAVTELHFMKEINQGAV